MDREVLKLNHRNGLCSSSLLNLPHHVKCLQCIQLFGPCYSYERIHFTQGWIKSVGVLCQNGDIHVATRDGNAEFLGSPQISEHAQEFMTSKARFSQLLPLHIYRIIHVHKTTLKKLYSRQRSRSFGYFMRSKTKVQLTPNRQNV